MPKMGDGMVEGTLLAWKKRDGDEVNVGDVIAEIETDKSNVEMEAEDAGVLRTQVAEGTSVPVGVVIATIGNDTAPAASATAAPPMPAAAATPAEADGTKNVSAAQQQKMAIDAPAPRAAASALSAAPSTPSASVPRQPASPAPSPAAAPQKNGASQSARIKASPLARRIAREQGVALEGISGSGPNGRIIEADVKAAAAQPKAAAVASVPTQAPVAGGQGFAPSNVPGERVPMSTMRNVIGRRMVESKSQVPHFYLTVEVDMDAAMDLRKQLNALDDSLSKISLNDFVVKASALALMKVPDVNRIYQGDSYIQPTSANVGIAVALEDGLIVPVVKEANTKSLRAIAKEARGLIDKARARKLQPQEYSGGTFTVSNLGSFDIDNFIAIIDPAQGGILAVASIRKMPVVLADDTIAVRSRMNITLSGDHRVMDGASGAKFMQELKRLLQNPLILLEH